MTGSVAPCVCAVATGHPLALARGCLPRSVVPRVGAVPEACGLWGPREVPTFGAVYFS